MLSNFPLDVSDEIWDVIESVSEVFFLPPLVMMTISAIQFINPTMPDKVMARTRTGFIEAHEQS